jgi:hypothetical protein
MIVLPSVDRDWCQWRSVAFHGPAEFHSPLPRFPIRASTPLRSQLWVIVLSLSYDSLVLLYLAIVVQLPIYIGMTVFLHLICYSTSIVPQVLLDWLLSRGVPGLDHQSPSCYFDTTAMCSPSRSASTRSFSMYSSLDYFMIGGMNFPPDECRQFEEGTGSRRV